MLVDYASECSDELRQTGPSRAKSGCEARRVFEPAHSGVLEADGAIAAVRSIKTLAGHRKEFASLLDI